MKKLLLVAVSVGVFLMVTIIAAIVILTPKAQTQEAAFYTSVPFSHGRVQPAEDIFSNMPSEPVSNVIETPNIVSIPDRDNGDSLTIQIPRPSTAAVPDNREVTVAPAQRPAAAAPAQRPATTASPAVRPAARAVNDYWIQIGAYSAIVRAEDVKENLAAKGLITIIENRVVNGQNLYRVRLGPYASEREANHWLAIVKSIDGFSDSQVRQTTRQQ